MKKYLLIFCLLLIVTGCGNKIVSNSDINIDYGEKEYSIYMPYKTGVSSYALNDDLIRHDTTNMDKVLMNLSQDYFNPKDYYYQSGQYLTTDKLKYLLSKDKLNNKTTTINGKSINHNFISTIYEQDYLNSNGEIKGISIILGLNKYHKVNNDVMVINENEVLEIGKQKGQEIISYIHAVNGMDKLNIVVCLYMEPLSTSSDNGSVSYIGINDGNKINFNKKSYGEYQVTSTYVKSNDNVTYQNYNTLVSFLKEEYNSLNISCKCVYKDKVLIKLIYIINTTYKDASEIMAINQSFIDEVSKLINNDVKIELVIKENKSTVSFLNRSGESVSVKLIEGE